MSVLRINGNAALYFITSSNSSNDISENVVVDDDSVSRDILIKDNKDGSASKLIIADATAYNEK
jgi:hypothetical protein